ncbi:M-phase inducer phosphatase 1-B-like [Paramacrobiotus metropolitanus]|uniref:M-phase inducer phosphatase 1-B-like n=1 Tax=Paramacrobiotus metropolitanus TaxID=2943436 RepID=UPI00244604ED|nr:M-phase inducer phosphatase 1-B-like [Paramacrobiotus metropolitanus]
MLPSKSGLSFHAMIHMDVCHSPEKDTENGAIRKTLNFDSSESSSDERMDTDMEIVSVTTKRPCTNKKKRFVQSTLRFSSSPSVSPRTPKKPLATMCTNTPRLSTRPEKKREVSKVSPTWTGSKDTNCTKRVTESVLVRKRKIASDCQKMSTNQNCLPTVRGRHGDIRYITCETLSQLMHKPLMHGFARLSIVDCRYPYEFQAGHIRGAVNIHSSEQLLTAFFSSTVEAKEERNVIIFHCEFSSKRGPDLARLLREEDRKRNAHRYPVITFPDVYVLEGGYKAFFESFQSSCDPPFYKTMDADGHEEELFAYRKTSKPKPAQHKRMRSSLNDHF